MDSPITTYISPLSQRPRPSSSQDSDWVVRRRSRLAGSVYRDYLRLDAAGSFDKMADLRVGIGEVDMFHGINIDIFE